MSQENNPISDISLNDICKVIDDYYWVMVVTPEKNSIKEIVDNLDEDCRHLEKPFKSFITNLQAAESLLRLPYMIIAKINKRNLIPKAPIDLEQLSPEARKQYVDYMIEFVKLSLHEFDNVLSDKKNELKFLMYQACILIWSALENFCKDTFILALNQRPQLYFKLQNNSFLKDRLSISQVSWQKLLEEHDFDLNGKLGYILANNKDFSSPKLLQEIFHCIFEGFPEDPNSLDYFKDEKLWVLGQRRNLIAHRCGIVDEEYLNKTNDSQQKLGEPLLLKTYDIEHSMGIARQCAIVLYGNARHCWPRPENPKF